MQVMILDDDPAFRAELWALLAPEGLEAMGFGDVATAKTVTRRAILDLLVLGERVGGRLAHDVALLAEWRNPGLGTVLRTDRTAEAREELFELLPSLRAVLPARAGAAAVARATLASARRLGPAQWHGNAFPASGDRRVPGPRMPGPHAERAGVPALTAPSRRLHLA